MIDAIDSGTAPLGDKPRSLFQFLAWRGGLRPHPELGAILDKRNPFVPGAGSLIRKSGMTLDGAREACVEAGFLRGLQDECEEASINDLLELIDAEARGRKQYRAGQYVVEPARVEGNNMEKPPTKIMQRRYDNQEALEMTPQEFCECLDKIGLSVYAASAFFGISLRQAQRYASGMYAPPLALVRLLRLMVKKHMKAIDLDYR